MSTENTPHHQYKFICVICTSPMVLHHLFTSPEQDIFAVVPCACKGVVPEVTTKPSAKLFFLNDYRKPKNVTK